MKRLTWPALLAVTLLAAGCSKKTDDRVQGYVEGEFVYVASPYAGALETLSVQRGAQVKAGDPLFTLESGAEKAARDEAARKLAQVQAKLLARAAGWLAPGGRLVYAVCSLEREEGEGQTLFLPLTPDRITAEELPAGLLPTTDGWLRTDPGMLAEAGGMDGFFIGRWTA